MSNIRFSLGFGFGTSIAAAISYATNQSIWLSISHGLLGWIYVVYQIIQKNPSVITIVEVLKG